MCFMFKKQGERAYELGDGFKIFYYGMDAKRNGVGVVVDPELKRSVLSVERKSDRMIWVKLAVDKQIINIASVYAPQTGCEEEEKDKFCNQLGNSVMAISESEQLRIGGDLNGRVGEGNAGHEACIGRHGFGERNEQGDRITSFATAGGLAIVNTFFKKRTSQQVTFTSGGNNTQVDYMLCRRTELKQVVVCNVIPGECVAKQHKPVVCKAKLKGQQHVRQRTEKRTRWWKLEDQTLREDCRESERKNIEWISVGIR